MNVLFLTLSILLSGFSSSAFADGRVCQELFRGNDIEQTTLSAERSAIQRAVLEDQLTKILEHRQAIWKRSTKNGVEDPMLRNRIFSLGERLKYDGLVSIFQVKALETMLQVDGGLIFLPTPEFQRVVRDAVDLSKFRVGVDAMLAAIQAYSAGRGIVQDTSERKRIAQDARSYFRTFESLNDFQFQAYEYYAGFFRNSQGLGNRSLDLGGRPIRTARGISNSVYELILAADSELKLEALNVVGLYAHRPAGTLVAGLGIRDFGSELLIELREITSPAAFENFRLNHKLKDADSRDDKQ